MKILVDTHTHSVASGHAYSTIQEMAREAGIKGIGMLALTDHGPQMRGGPYLYHFSNLRVIPRELYGVKILRGVEANIMDYEGGIDMPDAYVKRLDFVLASFHEVCITPSGQEENTKAMIAALSNPYVDAIGHPGNPQYPVEIDRVVRAASQMGKLIEINNSSFFVRKGSEKNCREFVRKCKEYRTRVVCGSDAHISFDVGKFDKVEAVFEEEGMPEELVLNTSVEKIEAYLEEKKNRLGRLK